MVIASTSGKALDSLATGRGEVIKAEESAGEKGR